MSPLADKRDIVVAIFVWCMCMVRAFARLSTFVWTITIHAISRAVRKKLTELQSFSGHETKTSRKEKNPMLNFSQGNVLQTVIFRLVVGVAAMITGGKEKPIASVTEILAEVFKLPFNPSHFLDDKCSKNKQ